MIQPYYDDGTCTIYHGDCRDLLADLCGDVVVTDPPYGLAFMGKAWDRVDQPFHKEWANSAFRALPPGGWLLAFGGTRTWHRLACGVEDAGFEVRDTLMWLYGQGFPKGKACLKPGWEPILLARKPGMSVLQIDASRVAGTPETPGSTPPTRNGNGATYGEMKRTSYEVPAGRWPANVVLTHGEGCQPVGVRKVRPVGATAHRGEVVRSATTSFAGKAHPGFKNPDGTETVETWACEENCPVFLLDQQSGETASRPGDRGLRGRHDAGSPSTERRKLGTDGIRGHADKGGASRFFYTAKAGRTERITVDGESHPTVKPLALMRWLVRLVTPPGGTVLDPFCGSGSTLVAARMEGFRAIGVEADERWCRGSAQRGAQVPPLQETLAI